MPAAFGRPVRRRSRFGPGPAPLVRCFLPLGALFFSGCSLIANLRVCALANGGAGGACGPPSLAPAAVRRRPVSLSVSLRAHRQLWARNQGTHSDFILVFYSHFSAGAVCVLSRDLGEAIVSARHPPGAPISPP